MPIHKLKNKPKKQKSKKLYNFKNKTIKNSKKRAVSQLDWVMSLALFLLYLAWFFSFILPNLNFQKNKNTNLYILKENFITDFSYITTKTPLFIISNKTFNNKPIIIDFPYSYNLFSEEDIIFYENKLLLLTNITQKKIINFYENLNISKNNNFYNIQSDEEKTSVNNMVVYFSNSLPKKIIYKQNSKILDINYKINSISFNPSNFSHEKDLFLSSYKAKTGNINFSTLIFSDNHEIYFLITNPETEKYELELDLDLDNYASYYSDNLHFGNFSYSSEKQYIRFFSDKITLYNNNDKLTLFIENSQFNITNFNDTLKINIKTEINNSLFKISFDSDPFNPLDINKKDYDYSFGIKEIESFILLDKNENSNYTFYKNKIDFDFYISIYNETNSEIFYELGINNPKKRQVYAETESYMALKENNIFPVLVNFRIW
ncbi:MAG: hypothetical protein QXE31_02570 [Candidatus Woesearchaeota archaeon]